MKEVIFRPLRRIKKINKVTVASYTQWRKVMTADYNKFNLVIDDEYKKFPMDEYVYNHKGELLYFFEYNPGDVPVFQFNPLFDLEAIRASNKYYGIRWDIDSHINYNTPLTDCDGVPTFSHWTADYIADYYKEVNYFEPLTVKVVLKWFGWFIFQLNNSYLKIGINY